MARLRYNGLTGALGGSLTSSATAVTFAAALTHSGGTNVPTIVAGDYIPLVILTSGGHVSEIVYLTAYTSGGTSGTIVRGREGTSGTTHSNGDGVICSPLASEVRDYRLDPGVLHATYGDHFDTASLDAKWNRQNFTSTNEEFQSGELRAWPGRGDSCFVNRQAASANWYYWQAAPSGDFTVVMRASIIGSACMFGPMILDSSGNGVVGAVYSGPDGYFVLGASGGSYNSTSQTLAPLGGANPYVFAGGPTWYRLNKTGTAYKASVSINGQQWLPYTSTITFATTPTRIGFGNILGSNSLSLFAVDFFDVQ